MSNQGTLSANKQQLTGEQTLEKWLPVIRSAVIVIGVGILAALGYLVFNSVNERKAEQAFAALAAADLIEERSIKEFQGEKQEFLQIITQWPESKKTEYVQSLEKVLKDYTDASAVGSAGLRLAGFYMALKDYPNAEKYYQEVVKRVDGKKVVLFKALAYEGLAVAQETQSKNEDALKTYSDFVNLKDSPLKPLALMGQARLQEILGKKDEATKSYDLIIKDFAGSAYERQARVLQSLLKSGQS
jgi:tetratricopeptide (TPR) repeat protein